MAKLNVESRSGQSPGGNEFAVVAPTGLITSDTGYLLEEVLVLLAKKPKTRVMIDFAGVSYINSSGLGQLITHLDAFMQAQGDMVLANVLPEVKRVMRLLGIDKVLKVVLDEKAAGQYFDDGDSTVFEKAFQEVAASPLARKKKKKLKPSKTSFPLRPEEAKVVYAGPGQGVFSDILKFRWGSNGNGRFNVVSSAAKVDAAIRRESPDLLIIDNTIADSDKICEVLKKSKESSLISVIRLYASGEGADQIEGFYVRENEFVTEPFEISELIALAEAELRRAASERKTFVHQIHFQFQSMENDLDRGIDFIAELIRQSGAEERESGELRTAVREAIDNAYRHGNRSQAKHRVYVNYVLDQERIIITVEDEGEGFDSSYYLALGREADAAERARRRRESGRSGGLGIMLMMKCLDSLEYNPVGNLVKLTKRIR